MPLHAGAEAHVKEGEGTPSDVRVEALGVEATPRFERMVFMVIDGELCKMSFIDHHDDSYAPI